MAPLDPSSSKCYTLELPNGDSKDARLRLDVRTGASWMIVQSRIMVYGGCTMPLEIPDTVTLSTIKQQLYEKAKGLDLDLDTVNFNDYFSNEVFSLNLIERNWTHLRNKGTKCPVPRIFHAMSVYDSYLYVHGGISWNNETRELEVVNDGWRFDLYDQKWHCVAPEAPSRCHRFDHKLLFLPNLDFVGRPRHYGFLILGGRERDDSSVHFSNLFDLVDQQFVGLSHRFQEASTSDSDDTSLSFNETNNTALLIPPLEGSGTTAKSLLAYLKTPSDSKKQPLIAYPLASDSKGIRVRSNKQQSIRDLRNVPFELNYPSSGYFGDNIILTGFLPGDLNISMFIYNRPTLKWSRVQAFCQHSTWSHRFCKGFVWSSHHKIILLGNNETSLTPPSVQFFNLYLSVSLPFTNALGTFSQNFKTDVDSKKDSEGLSTDKSSDTKTPRSSVAFPPKSKKASTSFAAYSHYIVPNVSITPITAVFPPYAIALGKDAFERKSSISDFEFVSSEGDLVPISMNLCRKRWGPCFDRLLAKAYARAIVERDMVKRTDDVEAEKSNTQAQHKSQDPAISTSNTKEFGEPLDRSFTGHSRADTTSSKSSLDSQPQFRLPFQDNSSESNSRLSSPQPQSSSGPTQVFSARRGSATSNTYYTAVSNSRRGSTGLLSPTIPSSRRGSVPSALSLTSSRRDSSTNYFSNNPNLVSNSRRNSAVLNNTNPFSSQSRHNSILRRSSVASSNSATSSLLSMTPPTFNKMTMSVPPSSQPRITSPPLAPTEGVISPPTTLLLKSLPDQPPMPSGILPPSFGSSSETRLNSEFQSPTGANFAASTEESPRAVNASKSTSGSSQNVDPKEITSTIFPEDLKLDPKFIPRSMCLPFSTTTTKAFSEFLYTGQVGSNWRVVPTAIEVFMMSKFYEIPLLYDLLSEVFYSILAKKESQLVKMANQLKFDIVTSDLAGLLGKDENNLGVSAIDEYTSYLTKVDDGQLDLTLLKRASKAAGSAYSHSDDGNSFAHGSISTNMTFSDDNRRKSVSLLPTRIRNSIATFASNDSEDFFQKNHSTRSSRSSRRGSRVSNSAVHTPSAPVPRSQLSQSIVDANSGFSSDEQNESSENDAMKNTIATVNQSSYDSNSSQDEANAAGETAEVEPKSTPVMEKTASSSEIPLPGLKSAAATDSAGKSKSADSKGKTWPTFKELSSPGSPPCSDIIVDLLVEAGALDTDMKLMLRALNAKEMAVQLRNQTKEFHKLLKEKKEADERNKRLHTTSSLELSKLQKVNSTGLQSKTTDDSNTFDAIRRTGSNDLRGQAMGHAGTVNIASTQDALANVSLSDLRSGNLGSPISKFPPIDPASTNSSELNLSMTSTTKGGRKISSFFKKKPTN